ncbi:hypothetical protein FNQ90_02470 [Streptomyces alkaliphilus]|uniref:Uncharacterized protein n=1 Tax=Streptomyces alkaliphilus TaxID=1472722 RepID=A0A7W3TAH5_9ACTN|nr:hypothetical protein [Streptomyces alkaliphilus]MBB0243000.1 hypothetical protein [Streptomyces alkaliphilus]
MTDDRAFRQRAGNINVQLLRVREGASPSEVTRQFAKSGDFDEGGLTELRQVCDQIRALAQEDRVQEATALVSEASTRLARRPAAPRQKLSREGVFAQVTKGSWADATSGSPVVPAHGARRRPKLPRRQ